MDEVDGNVMEHEVPPKTPKNIMEKVMNTFGNQLSIKRNPRNYEKEQQSECLIQPT